MPYRSPTLSPSHTVPRKRILVIEDHYLLARLLVGLVEECGYDVVGPVAGRAAPAALHAEEFEGVLLHVRPKDRLGIELARVLIARRVPLVLHSSERSSLPSDLADTVQIDTPVVSEPLRAAFRRVWCDRD